MKKRMMVLLITAALIVTLIPISAMAGRIDDSDVFLTQAPGSADCTAAASAMMLRRAALMCGNDNWSSITIDAVKSVGWINGTGLSADFWCEGFEVAKGYLPNDNNEKINWLIYYLKNHREGIVVYTDSFYDARGNENWHAILLTDYDEATGTFYCGDSGNANLSGRRPVSDSTMKYHIGTNDQATIMSYFKSYWYITNSPACQHQLVTESAAASATADGYNKEYCTVCGYTSKDEVLHNWEDKELLKEKTTTDEDSGLTTVSMLYRQVCTNCQLERTKQKFHFYGPSYTGPEWKELAWEIIVNAYANYVEIRGDMYSNLKELIDLFGELGDNFWKEVTGSSTPGKLKLSGMTTIPDNFMQELAISIGEIELGDGVTSIGENAFSGCTSLKSVVIPNSVTSIAASTFSGCTGLKSATISNGVKSIGSSAFSGCTSLESVVIPSSVTSIAASTFSGCTSLASVTIPNSVTSIEVSAFSGCTSLESVVIPDSVTKINNLAFRGCTSLKKITMPISAQISLHASASSGLTDICILDRCNNIEEVVFTAGSSGKPCSGEYQYLFQSSRSTLKSIRFEEGVKAVPSYICYECKALTSAYLPSTLETIGEKAFYNCAALKDISIPDNVTSIGSYAFYGCASIPSITLPSGITAISAYTFTNCASLASVMIPNSVTSIDYDAFSGCKSLADVYFGGTEEQWNEITIATGNDPLTKANIHFADTPTGDLTGDGDVDVTDLIRLKKYIADNTTALAGDADLNGDGIVDILDLIRLKKIIAGETSFT